MYIEIKNSRCRKLILGFNFKLFAGLTNFDYINGFEYVIDKTNNINGQFYRLTFSKNSSMKHYLSLLSYLVVLSTKYTYVWR